MIYDIENNVLNESFGYSGEDLTNAYDIDDVEVFAKESGTEDGNEPTHPTPQEVFSWSKVKWVPFGDSIIDLTLSGKSSNPSDYKMQLYLKELLPKMEVVNYSSDNTKRFGSGGCGYWRGNNNFLSLVQYVPTDATIITLFGSVNDWQYRNISTTYGNPLSKENSGTPSGKNGVVTWIKNPHLDSASDNTLAGYVADTIKNLHQRCPKAKIVVNSGMNYAISGVANNKYMLNAYFCIQSVAQALIDNGANWLTLESWYYKANVTRTIDEDGNSIYTRNDSFVEDTLQLDKWFSGNINGTFDSRRIVESEFGQEYCYDFHNDGTSFGHFGNKYHHRYLAVKFAHTLINVLGGSESDLPDALKYNNIG